MHFTHVIWCPGLLGWLGSWAYMAAWLWLPTVVWQMVRAKRDERTLRPLCRAHDRAPASGRPSSCSASSACSPTSRRSRSRRSCRSTSPPCVGLSPLAYGFVDGLYQGVSALVRILGGWLSDRADRPEVGRLRWATALVRGHQGRCSSPRRASPPSPPSSPSTGWARGCAPRPATRSSPRPTPEHSLGRAFGVHRALDTTGAAIGPLMAFAILWLVPGDYSAVFVASLAAALFGVALLGAAGPRPATAAAARRTAAPHRVAAVLAQPRPSARFGRVVVAAALLGRAHHQRRLPLPVAAAARRLRRRRGSRCCSWAPTSPTSRWRCRWAGWPTGSGRARVLVGGHLLLVGAYLCAALPPGGLAADGRLPAPARRVLRRHRRRARRARLDARPGSRCAPAASPRPRRSWRWPGSPPRCSSAPSGRAGSLRRPSYAVAARWWSAVAVAWWLLRHVDQPAEPVPA